MQAVADLVCVLCMCCLAPLQVQWQGKGPEAATWLTRDDLVEMGLEKMVVDLDMKEAARAVSMPAAALCFLLHCTCSVEFHAAISVCSAFVPYHLCAL